MRIAPCTGTVHRREESFRPACERGAIINPTTRVHARATFRRQILPVCGALVVAVTRPYPRFPRQNLDSVSA